MKKKEFETEYANIEKRFIEYEKELNNKEINSEKEKKKLIDESSTLIALLYLSRLIDYDINNDEKINLEQVDIKRFEKHLELFFKSIEFSQNYILDTFNEDFYIFNEDFDNLQ